MDDIEILFNELDELLKELRILIQKDEEVQYIYFERDSAELMEKIESKRKQIDMLMPKN